MTKYHSINDKIDLAMVDKVLQIYSDNDCKDHVIYFTSVGGENRCTHALVDATKNYMSRGGRVMFIFYGNLFSNGFELIFALPREAVCYVQNEIVAMVHLACLGVDLLSNGKGATQDDAAKLVHLKSLQDKHIDYLKTIGLTEKELRGVKKGDDVYLHTERTIELLSSNGIKSTEVLLQTNNATT